MLNRHLREALMDDANRVHEGIHRASTQDTGTHEAFVQSYDQSTHTARVVLARGGAHPKGITVKGLAGYVGPTSGQSAVAAHFPGQPVLVSFDGGSAIGLYNKGTITGTWLPHQDHKPPAYAPWIQQGTGIAALFPNGNAYHQGAEVESDTRKAFRNVDDWGHEYNVTTGIAKTHSQQRTEDAATGLRAAASLLA